MKQLVLASRSPARKEILQRTGIAFTVDVSNYKEDMTLSMPPQELAKYLSKGKALDVAARHKNAVVLGADSFAELNGQLMGKPHTNEKAKQMLRGLSGQAHSFITGFTIIDSDSKKEVSGVSVTKVYFKKLTAKDIDNYLAREDVLNNAGAYIIQELGSVLVEKIDGSYTNVMGLPLARVADALKEFGIDFLKA